MKTSKILILLILGAMIIFGGCANTGMYLSSHQTQIQLTEPNFRIVAKNVSGEAKSAHLFGLTYSLGAMTETIGLIKLEGTGKLYQEAMEDLWNNYEKAHGPVEGKKLALVNVRYDSDFSNWIVYTGANIFIRADVIEFQED